MKNILVLAQRQTEDVLHLHEMPRLDHAVRFVEHEEAELLDLLGELIVLPDTPYVSAYKGTTGRHDAPLG